MNNLNSLVDSLLSPSMPREQKAILFGEFQGTLEENLLTMNTDRSGIHKNQMCAFLGNFFVRVQPGTSDSYDLQVRKAKLRDIVIQKISDVNQAKGMSLNTEDWEQMKSAKMEAQEGVRKIHRAVRKIEETVDRQGLRLVVFSFSQVKLRSFSLKGVQFGSDMTLARVGKLNSVLGHFSAKRENRLSLRRSFLRWMVRSNPFFVKDCVDRMALTTTLKKEIAVWRMKKMVEVALTIQDKKFQEFSQKFFLILQRAQARETLSRKNFFLFALGVIKEKDVRQEWANKTRKMVNLVNSLVGERTQVLVKNNRQFNPSKTLSTRLVGSYNSKMSHFMSHMQFGNKKKNFAKGYKFFYCITNLYARKVESVMKSQISLGSSSKLGSYLFSKVEGGQQSKFNELRNFSSEKRNKIENRHTFFGKLERLMHVHDKHCFFSEMKRNTWSLRFNEDVFNNCLKVLRRSNKEVIASSLRKLRNNSFEVVKTNKIRILFWLEKSQRRKLRESLRILTGRKQVESRNQKQMMMKRLVSKLKSNYEFKLRLSLERLSTLAGLEVQYEEWESSASHKRFLFNKMQTSMLNLKSIAMERLFRNYEYRRSVIENCMGMMVSKSNKKLSWAFFTLLIETLSMEKEKQPGQVRILMVVDRLVKEKQRRVFNSLRSRKQATENFILKLGELFNKVERKQKYQGFNGMQRKAGDNRAELITKENQGVLVRRTLTKMMREWDQQQHRAMGRLRRANTIQKNAEKVLLKGLKNGIRGKTKESFDKLRTENLLERLYEEDLDLAGKLNRGGDLLNRVLLRAMKQYWGRVDRPRKMVGSGRKLGMMLESKMKGEALSQSMRRLRENKEQVMFEEMTEESLHMRGNLMNIQNKVLPKYQDRAFTKNFVHLEQLLKGNESKGLAKIKKHAENKSRATKILTNALHSYGKNRSATALSDLQTNVYIMEEQDKLDGLICRNSSKVEKKITAMSQKRGMDAIKKEAQRNQKLESVFERCFAKHWKVDSAFEALKMNKTIRKFLTQKQSRDVMKNHLAGKLQKLFEKKQISNDRTLFRTLKRKIFKEKILKKLMEGVSKKLKLESLENLRKFNLKGKLEGDISHLKQKLQNFYIKKMVGSLGGKLKTCFFGLRLNNRSESTRQLSERFIRDMASKRREQTFSDLKYFSMKTKEESLIQKNTRGGLVVLMEMEDRRKRGALKRLGQYRKDKNQAERVLMRIMKTMTAQLKRDALTMMLNINRVDVWEQMIRNEKMQTFVNIIELKLLKRYALLNEIKKYSYERKIAMDVMGKYDKIIKENMKRGLDRLRSQGKGGGVSTKKDFKERMTKMFMTKINEVQSNNKAAIFFKLRTFKNLQNRKLRNLMVNLKRAGLARQLDALRNLTVFKDKQNQVLLDQMLLPKLLKNKTKLQKQNVLSKLLNFQKQNEDGERRKDGLVRNLVSKLSGSRWRAFQKLQRNSEAQANREKTRNLQMANVLGKLDSKHGSFRDKAFEKLYESSENNSMTNSRIRRSQGTHTEKDSAEGRRKVNRKMPSVQRRRNILGANAALRNIERKFNQKYGGKLQDAFYRLVCTSKRQLDGKLGSGFEYVLNKKNGGGRGFRKNHSRTLTQYIINKEGQRVPVNVIGGPLDIVENRSYFIDKNGNKVVLPDSSGHGFDQNSKVHVYVDENGNNVVINNSENVYPNNPQNIIIDQTGGKLHISTGTDFRTPAGKNPDFLERSRVDPEVVSAKDVVMDQNGNLIAVNPLTVGGNQGSSIKYYVDENGRKLPIENLTKSESNSKKRISHVIDENGNKMEFSEFINKDPNNPEQPRITFIVDNEGNQVPIGEKTQVGKGGDSVIQFYVDEHGRRIPASNVFPKEGGEGKEEGDHQNTELSYVDQNGDTQKVEDLTRIQKGESHIKYFVDDQDNQHPIEDLGDYLDQGKVKSLVDQNGNSVSIEKKPKSEVTFIEDGEGNKIPVVSGGIKSVIEPTSVVVDKNGNKILVSNIRHSRLEQNPIFVDKNGKQVPTESVLISKEPGLSNVIINEDNEEVPVYQVQNLNGKSSQVVFGVDEEGRPVPVLVSGNEEGLPIQLSEKVNKRQSTIVFGVDDQGKKMKMSLISDPATGQSHLISQIGDEDQVDLLGDEKEDQTQLILAEDQEGNKIPFQTFRNLTNDDEPELIFGVDQEGRKIPIEKQDAQTVLMTDNEGRTTPVTVITNPRNQKESLIMGEDQNGERVLINSTADPLAGGKLVFYLDENGNKVPCTEKDIKDLKDLEGDQVFLDKSGSPQPLETLLNPENTNEHIKFFVDGEGVTHPIQNLEESLAQKKVQSLVDNNGESIPIHKVKVDVKEQGVFVLDDQGNLLQIVSLIQPMETPEFYEDAEGNKIPVIIADDPTQRSSVLVNPDGRKIPLQVTVHPKDVQSQVIYGVDEHGKAVSISGVSDPLNKDNKIISVVDSQGQPLPIDLQTNLNKGNSNIIYGVDQHGNTIPLVTPTSPHIRESQLLYGVDEQGNSQPIATIKNFQRGASKVVYGEDQHGKSFPLTLIQDPNTGASHLIFGEDDNGNLVSLSEVPDNKGKQSQIVSIKDQHGEEVDISEVMDPRSHHKDGLKGEDQEGRQINLKTVLIPATENIQMLYAVDDFGNKVPISKTAVLNGKSSEIIFGVDEQGNTLPIATIENPDQKHSQIIFGNGENEKHVPMLHISKLNSRQSNILFGNDNKLGLIGRSYIVPSKDHSKRLFYSDIEGRRVPLNPTSGEGLKYFVDKSGTKQPISKLEEFIKKGDVSEVVDSEDKVIPVDSVDPKNDGSEYGYNSSGLIVIGKPTDFLNQNEGLNQLDVSQHKNLSGIEDEPIALGDGHVLLNGEVYQVDEVNDRKRKGDISGEDELDFDLEGTISKNGKVYRKTDGFDMGNGMTVDNKGVFEDVEDEDVDSLIDNFNTISQGYRTRGAKDEAGYAPFLRKFKGKVYMEMTDEVLDEDVIRFIEKECKPGEIHKMMINKQEVLITVDEEGRIFRIGDNIDLPNGYYLKNGELKKKVGNRDLGNGLQIRNGKLMKKGDFIEQKVGGEEENFMSRTSQIIDDLTGYGEGDLEDLEKDNQDLRKETQKNKGEAERLSKISKSIVADNSQLEKERKNLLLAQKVFGTNIQNLGDDLDLINEQKSKEEEKLRKKEVESSQLEQKLDTSRSRMKKMEMEKKDLEQEKEDLQDKKEELKDKKDKVEAGIESGQRQVGDVTGELERVKEEESDMKGEKRDLESKKEKAEGEKEDIEKQKRLLDKDQKKLVLKEAQLDREVKQLENEEKNNERKQKKQSKELEDLRERVAKKNGETRELNQDLEDKYQEIKNMNEEYQKKGGEINNLNEENAELLGKHEEMKEQKEEVEGDIYDLKKNLREMGDPDKKTQEFQDRMDVVNKKLEDAKAELSTILNEITLVEEEMEDQENKFRELEEDIRKMKADADAKLNESNALFDQADALDAEGQRRRDQGDIEGAEEAEEEARKKRDAAQKLIEDAEEMENSIFKKEGELKETGKELEKMKDLKNTIEDRKKKFEGIVEEKENELEDLEKEFEDWKVKYNEKVDQLNEKMEDLDALNGEMSDVKKSLQKNEILMKKLEGDRDILIKDIEKEKLDIAQQVKRVESLRKEAKELEDKIEEGEGRLEDLEGDAVRIRDQKKKVVGDQEEVRRESEDMKRRRGELEEKEGEVDAKMLGVEKRMKNIEKKLEDARQQRSEMNLKIGDLKRDIERKKNQLDLLNGKEVALENKEKALDRKDGELGLKIKNEGEKMLNLELSLEKTEDEITNRKKKLSQLDDEAAKKEEKIYENQLKKNNASKNLSLNESQLQKNINILSKNKEKEARLRGKIGDNEFQITENQDILNRANGIRASLLYQDKYLKDMNTQTGVTESEREMGIRERLWRLKHLSEDQLLMLEDPDQIRKIGILKFIDNSAAEKIQDRGGLSERDLDALDDLSNRKTRDASSSTHIGTGMGLEEEDLMNKHQEEIDELKNKNSRLNQLIGLKQSEKDVAVKSLRNFMRDKLSNLIMLRFTAEKYKALQKLKNNKFFRKQNEIGRKLFLTSIKSKVYNKTVKKTVKRDIGTKREKGLVKLVNLFDKRKSSHYHYFKLMLHLRLMRLSLNALFKWKLDNLNLQNSSEYQDMILKKKLVDTLLKISNRKQSEALRKVEMKSREHKLIAMMKKLSTVVNRAGNKYYSTKQRAMTKWFRNRNINGWHDRILRRMVDKSTENQETALMKMFLFRRNKGGKGHVKDSFGVTRKMKNKAVKLQKILKKITLLPVCRAFQKLASSNWTQNQQRLTKEQFPSPRVIKSQARQTKNFESKPSQISISYNEMDFNDNFNQNRHASFGNQSINSRIENSQQGFNEKLMASHSLSFLHTHTLNNVKLDNIAEQNRHIAEKLDKADIFFVAKNGAFKLMVKTLTSAIRREKKGYFVALRENTWNGIGNKRSRSRSKSRDPKKMNSLNMFIQENEKVRGELRKKTIRVREMEDELQRKIETITSFKKHFMRKHFGALEAIFDKYGDMDMLRCFYRLKK